jgi:hypothetical protein
MPRYHPSTACFPPFLMHTSLPGDHIWPPNTPRQHAPNDVPSCLPNVSSTRLFPAALLTPPNQDLCHPSQVTCTILTWSSLYALPSLHSSPTSAPRLAWPSNSLRRHSMSLSTGRPRNQPVYLALPCCPDICCWTHSRQTHPQPCVSCEE